MRHVVAALLAAVACISLAPVAEAQAVHSAAAVAINPANAATDVFTISGAAGRIVEIRDMHLSGSATTTATFVVQLVRRSTADTAGTSTSPTIAPHDTAKAASLATVKAYTANPTVGTSAGVLRTMRLTLDTSSKAASVQSSAFLLDGLQDPIVIREGETLAVSFNGADTTPISELDWDVTYLEKP